MKRYLFKIELSGYGDTPEQAWQDATDSFAMEPGPMPDDTVLDDDDESDE